MSTGLSGVPLAITPLNRKEFITEVGHRCIGGRRQAECLMDLRSGVGGDGRDAQLGARRRTGRRNAEVSFHARRRRRGTGVQLDRWPQSANRHTSEAMYGDP